MLLSRAQTILTSRTLRQANQMAVLRCLANKRLNEHQT